MSPICLAKPMIWMSNSGVSSLCRTSCSSFPDEIEVVERLPGDRVVFQQVGDDHRARIVARDELADVAADDDIVADARDLLAGSSASGVMLPPITSSAWKPSSVISSTRVFGVHSDVTVRRSTPGRNITACVTSFSFFRKAAFQMSPVRCRTTTTIRLAPNTRSRYW